MVPGERISARVAVRASDLGSSPPISGGGTCVASCCKTADRCSGVSWANASSCARSMSSGGAVRSMYRYRSIAC